MKELIEGRKKFTATVTGIVASVLALFFTPEQAEEYTRLSASALPLILALFYDWIQGKQDVKKESVKEQEAILKQNEAAVEYKRLESMQPVEQPLAVEAPIFDMDAFMSKLNLQIPGETPEVKTFYAFRHLGMITPAHYIEHVLAYWDKYVELAQKAFVSIVGFPIQEAHEHLRDKDKDCPYTSVESMARHEGYFGLLLDVRHAQKNLRNLDRMVAAYPDLNWKAKLGGLATLYNVAERADELIAHA